MQDKITIADAPECLNTNDKAMWVLGYQAAIEARGSCLQQIQEPEDDIWPCVNIDVDESGNITNAKLYSPGLPAGNHDVYPVRVPYMDEHTEAWRACVDELEKAVPGFMSLGNMNGIECAVAAIRGLSERAKHQEPSAAEQAAWHAGLDEGLAQAAQRSSVSNAETPQAAPDERKDLVPGVMRCAKCEFQLVRQVLAVNLGEVFAGDSKTEPCPNDCGPLWPVTWKQYAEQAMDAAESMADRAFAAEKEVKQLRGELSALSTPNLRAKIMSTPLGLYGTGIGDIGTAYRAGHRAALLTAADLVASTVVAAPAAVAVPDFEEWRKREYPWLGPIGDGVQIAREAWSAALAATPAAVPTYIEVRECSDCGHIGINDADGSKAACSKCDWQGDSPVEDKCPDCNTVGTMTAACSKCGARASLLAETTLHAEPIAAAAPVVLPEPDAAVSEVMELVSAFGDARCSDAGVDFDGADSAKWREAIKSKLRSLMAGVSAPAAHGRASVTPNIDKWKLVDGDMRESCDGLLTYHADAYREGLADAPQSQADAQQFLSQGAIEKLQWLVKCSDSEMRDGDAARELAAEILDDLHMEPLARADSLVEESTASLQKKALEEERDRLIREVESLESEAVLALDSNYASSYDVSPGRLRSNAQDIRNRIAEINAAIEAAKAQRAQAQKGQA